MLKRRVSYFNGSQHTQQSEYPYYCENCQQGVFAKFDMKTGKAVVQ